MPATQAPSRRQALSWAAAIGAADTLPMARIARAQGKYPDKPVKLIVALPAGGSVDMVARALGDKLKTALGGTWIVDPEADYTPISRLVNQPTVLVVKDKQKYPTVAALLAAARAAPGQLTYASSGEGSPQHLAGLVFETRTKTKLLHVPYRGGALAINDTIGGQVEAMFAVMPEAVPHVLAGRLHPLGVMSPTRSAVMPQVPTMAEAGIADLNLSAWMALLAPARMPRPLVDELNRAVAKAFDPELRNRLAESGIEVATSTPEELQALISREIKLHAELVKAAGLVPQ